MLGSKIVHENFTFATLPLQKRTFQSFEKIKFELKFKIFLIKTSRIQALIASKNFVIR